MSEITIYIVVENEVLCSSEEIKVDVGNGRMLTEQGALATKLVGIFALNMVDASVYFTKREEVDGLQDRGLLRLNDFVVTFLDIDDEENRIGTTVWNPDGHKYDRLTILSSSQYHGHPESSSFLFMKTIHKLCRPDGGNRPYKVKNDGDYFEMIALTTAHEIYHAIINRSIKDYYLKENYVFGVELSMKIGNAKLGEEVNSLKNQYLTSDGHSPLDNKDMSKRKKQYSLNTSGESVGVLPFLISPYIHIHSENNDTQIKYTTERLIDVFFLNDSIKWKQELLANPDVKAVLPKEIIKSIESENGKPFTQGMSKSLAYRFRTDKLQKKYVEPFLKRFIPKKK